MEYLDYMNLHRFRGPRIGRQAIEDPFQSLTDEQFEDRFRFSKDKTIELITILQNSLQGSTRGRPTPVTIKVLLALRFFATGCLHRETGDLMGVSEASASRYIHQVAEAICKEMRKIYIKFPTGEDATATKQRFFQMHGFPGVLSCIDGTHIKISCPTTDDKEEYRNRKGYFSINVMAAVGPRYEFTHIIARWKGITHDSRVLKNSALFAKFEANEHSGILLADSGYQCNRFVMTPFGNPQTLAQENYNRAQRSTRAIVENAFGHWKGRFRCINSENTLRFEPKRCCKIIIATAVLHNFKKTDEIWLEDPPLPLVEQDEGEPDDVLAPFQDENIESRNDLLRRHFM